MMGMRTPTLPGRNVIQVKDTLYLEGNMVLTPNVCKVASRVIDLWQGDGLAVISCRFLH